MDLILFCDKFSFLFLEIKFLLFCIVHLLTHLSVDYTYGISS